MTTEAAPKRNYIAHWAEKLPGERGQMYCDVVIDNELVMSYPTGSPAPWETVKQYEYTVDLNRGTRK